MDKKDVYISDFSVVDEVDPYRTPESVSEGPGINVDKLRKCRTILMLFFTMLVLFSLMPRMLIQAGFDHEMIVTLYLISPVPVFLLSLGIVFYTYRVNSIGQSIFLAILIFVPLMNIYVFVRTMLVSRKYLRDA